MRFENGDIQGVITHGLTKNLDEQGNRIKKLRRKEAFRDI